MNLMINIGVFGDYSFINAPLNMVSGNIAQTEVPEEENYLQKGEKILSLLRERGIRPFEKDAVMELVKQRWELTQNAAARKIGEALEIEFLSFFKNANDYNGDLQRACDDLQKKLPECMTVKPEARARELLLMASLCQHREQAVINITYGDEDVVVAVGADFKKRFEGGCKFKSERGLGLVNTRMFARFIGEVVLREHLLKTLRKMREEGEEKYSSNRAIGHLQWWAKQRNTNNEYSHLQDLMSLQRDWQRDCYRMLLFYPQAPESEMAVHGISTGTLQDFLWNLKGDYDKVKEESKMLRELSKEHARSFEDKKNIPAKTVKAMSQSGFNEFFGYVEFDELCDLKLMEEIFKEYRAFAKELGIEKYPEVSLRFRKLGNHKAAGLYYPTLKCLCVDIRCPDSMAHEAGHMIDYHLDHISTKYVFQKVYNRYEELLKKHMRTSKEDAKVLKGSTKYNLKYYLQPTEVFARCFELYVTKVRGIDNSLCRPTGFAYPEDEKLVALIKEFYDGIFEKEERAEVEENEKIRGKVS